MWAGHDWNITGRVVAKKGYRFLFRFPRTMVLYLGRTKSLHYKSWCPYSQQCWMVGPHLILDTIGYQPMPIHV